MTAKRLEDFIGVIETAEKISGQNDSCFSYSLQSSKRSRSLGGNAPPQIQSHRGLPDPISAEVPRLALPSWSSSATPARLVGPPISHCGLSSISAFSTARENESSTLPPSHRSSLLETEQLSSTTARSSMPSTIRKGSLDQPQDLPPNLPFVRKILEDQHPASPEASPASRRKGSFGARQSLKQRQPAASRDSSLSPEKRSLPPRFPKPSNQPSQEARSASRSRDATSRSGAQPTTSDSGSETKPIKSNAESARTLIRNKCQSTDSSPEKTKRSRQSDVNTKSSRSQSIDRCSEKKTTFSPFRSHSSTPSPVRSTPPKPTASASYSSSFASSSASCSRSPSSSPEKIKSHKRQTSDESIEECLEDYNVSKQTEQQTVVDKRKSWATGSLSKRTVALDHDKDESEQQKASPIKSQSKSKNNTAKVVINDATDKKPRTPVSVRRKRPQSAPNRKPVKPPPIPVEPAAQLGNFSKSLKLLGVDIPSSRTEATTLTNQAVKVTTKEGNLKTRLLKRSGSYANLTQSINKDMKASEFKALKNKVADAVFEEWYFKKCAEERERKQKKDEAEEAERKEKEEKQKEIEEHSKEEFEKWCQQKKIQNAKDKKKKEILEKGKISKKIVSQEEIDKKTNEWMALKKKEAAKKKEMEEKKRLEDKKKKIEEEKKQEEAEKVFIAWRDAKTKELKERYAAEKKRQKEKEEALIESRKNADQVFIGWKNKKDEKVKDALAKKEELNKTEVVKVEESEETQNSKLEEAKRAYEAWLDLIEEREEENLLFEEERKRILIWKPPWYAGGKAMF